MDEEKPTETVEKTATLTPRKLAKLQKEKFAENAPDLLDKFYEAAKKRLDAGDVQAMHLVAKLMRLVEDKPMVSVNTNVAVQQNNGATRRQDRGVENIVRLLEQQQTPQRLIADKQQNSIQEAEFVDVSDSPATVAQNTSS